MGGAKPMSDKKINNSLFQVRLPIFVALGVAVGLLLGSTMYEPAGNNPQSTAKGYLKFRDILSYIDRDYVDTVNTEELADYAITKMLEKLDPHTSYIPVKEIEMVRSQLEGDFEGIGVEFNILHDTILVVAPISGGPSDQVGILAGDKIVKVDGENVTGKTLNNKLVFEKLRGPKGSKVKLTIKRKNEQKLMDYVVTRDKIPTYSVDVSYMVDDKTGYIKVSRFAANTYTEFKEHMAKLQKKGMQRLVLDLRDNPGGYMDRATQMADDFLAGNKMIVYTDGKGERYDSKIYTNPRAKGSFENGAVVVLINEGSASASEIVSGALQDHDRGLIVGRRSFGKGLVQMPIPLNDGSELRLTISRYYTPSGRSIQKPYSADNTEDYETELLTRFKHGEFYHADSIKFNDSLKYKTTGGRIVYGGGGIMPDVFVPRDTTEYTEYLGHLYSKNVLREFSLDYYLSNKKQFKKMTADQYIKNFEVTEAMMQQVLKRAGKEEIKFNETEYNRSKHLIKNTVKAFIGRSAYQAEGFYPVLHQVDDEFKQAIKQFGRAEKLAQGKLE